MAMPCPFTAPPQILLLQQAPYRSGAQWHALKMAGQHLYPAISIQECVTSSMAAAILQPQVELAVNRSLSAPDQVASAVPAADDKGFVSTSDAVGCFGACGHCFARCYLSRNVAASWPLACVPPSRPARGPREPRNAQHRFSTCHLLALDHAYQRYSYASRP